MLEKKGAPTIFPEGSHDNVYHLRQFKKGAARIAFGSEVKNNWKLGTEVIPVGTHYEKNRAVRKNVYVVFGEPILIKDYKEEYLANPEKMFVNFTNMLYQKIFDKVLHIYDLENADLIKEYFKILENNDVYQLKNKFKTFKERVDYNKQLAEKINAFSIDDPENYQHFITQLKDYFHNIKNQKYRDWQFANNAPNVLNIIVRSIVLIVLIPLWFFAFLNSLLTYCFTKFTIKKQFRSSNWMGTAKYIAALITGPIIFLLQSVVVYLLTKNVFVWLFYLLISPFLITFWYQYNKNAKMFFSQLRLLKNLNTAKVKALFKLRSNILDYKF